MNGSGQKEGQQRVWRIGQTVLCLSGCASVCRGNKNWDWALTLLRKFTLWLGPGAAGGWRV